MAEIQVERKSRSPVGLLLMVLLLVAVLGAGWYFMMGPGAGTLDRGADLEAPASMPGPGGSVGTPGGPTPGSVPDPGTTGPGASPPPEGP